MNPNQRTHACSLALAVLMLAAGSAWAGDTQPTKGNHLAQAASIAAESMALQQGDRALISRAIGSPMVFTQVPNERIFTGQLIVHPKPNKAIRGKARVAPLLVKESNSVDEYVIDVPKGMSEGELAGVLMATGDYTFVEPDWILYPSTVPNDPLFASSWQHSKIQSASAWDLSTGSANTIIAVCDTGVDLNHPDLMNSLVSGYNAANRRTQANGGLVGDIFGHGTFVSGCAAARGNNNIGVVGVGWNFSIMPVRITNRTDGTANLSDILDGARWAAENGASVVNVSFSGGTVSANQTTAAYLKTQGALLFWASGNDGAFVSPNFPDYVLVGATTSSDQRAGFSNFGPAVDVTAPGAGVRSTQNGGGYGTSSGTSFATPIAAGVGAMIYSINSEFSADDVQDILYQSVDDLGPAGRDDSFGRGRVNTRQAIEVAQAYVRPLPEPIFESFESSSWQDLLSATSGAVVTTTPPDAPDGASVLLMDATDTVESIALAGRSISGLTVLSFTLKAGSIEAGESLDVQYLENPEVLPNTWTTLLSINGQGRVANEFLSYDINLPSDYKWHGVKIRFAAHGSDSTDTWMIDALSINALPDSVAPLEEDFETGLIAGVRWDNVNGAQVGFENNNFFAKLSDGDQIESQDIPLDQFGIVPAFIRFDASVAGAVEGADQLNVEAFSIINTWISAGVINASDLTNTPQLIELDVPLPAIAIPNMRLRLTSSTTGEFRIDNVYVGVDELVTGCNQADFAEPFGELNFFDVSAFLSAFAAQDPSGDINSDGVYDFFDVSAFINIFGAGCP